MIDTGCASLLLPFPADTDHFNEFADIRFEWVIAQSRGTGALRSPVLKIRSRIRLSFPMILNGKELPIEIPTLRFHLGKGAAKFLVENKDYQKMLGVNASCKAKLENFLEDVGGMAAPERRHVLLGQSFIGQVFTAQLADITVFLDQKNGIGLLLNSRNFLLLVAKMQRQCWSLLRSLTTWKTRTIAGILMTRSCVVHGIRKKICLMNRKHKVLSIKSKHGTCNH